MCEFNLALIHHTTHLNQPPLTKTPVDIPPNSSKPHKQPQSAPVTIPPFGCSSVFIHLLEFTSARLQAPILVEEPSHFAMNNGSAIVYPRLTRGLLVAYS